MTIVAPDWVVFVWAVEAVANDGAVVAPEIAGDVVWRTLEKEAI